MYKKADVFEILPLLFRVDTDTTIHKPLTALRYSKLLKSTGTTNGGPSGVGVPVPGPWYWCQFKWEYFLKLIKVRIIFIIFNKIGTQCRRR